jgi:LuxR family transcriptional regulator, maltose regulon positive regulatory protein
VTSADDEEPAMALPRDAPLRFPARKGVVPSLPAGFVPRPRLLGRLDEAGPDQVVVVSAPAGSGKTLLLAEWVRHREQPETAWVRLDSDDNDPRRLWSAVVASLLALPSAGRDDRLRRLAGATRSDGVDVAEELADVLDTLGTPVRLVLDDVHELTGREVLHDLTRVVRQRPAGVRLVLASRADPPVSIPRLRLEGRVHELRADALAFTLPETTALLETTGLALTPSQVATLQARTEGWAAGLRLAVLALRRTEDAAGFLTSFSGDERSVAEYLTGEILDGLDADTQDFLGLVSVCSPLPAALAVALSQRGDAERVLDDLRQETALVERTSRGSYRIQPLLRSYLVADLARQRPRAHRQAQATAARWWSANGQHVHALRHAERSGDGDLTGSLVRGAGVPLLLGGDLGPLRRALAAVGPGARSADPWLALTAAITHLDARAPAAAAAELENARRAWPDTPDAGLVALRASAELLASGLGFDVGPARPSPDDADQDRSDLAALLHASRGAAEFGNPGGTDVDHARTELQQALDLARALDLGYLEVQSLSMLATLAAMRGDLREMAETSQQAVTAAARRGRHPSDWSAAPVGMLAYGSLLRGDPEAASAHAEEVLGLGDQLPPEAAYTLHAVHGAALADRGHRAAGLAEVQAAREAFGATPAPPSMAAALALLEHGVALLSGNPSAAAEVAAWLTARVSRTGETLLLRAREEMAAGRYGAAQASVAPVHDPATPVLLPQTAVEAHLVDAECALQAGDLPAGRASLEAALVRAESVGVARPLALAGPLTQELLDAGPARRGRARFDAEVAAARAALVSRPAVRLSERELAVLALLPSLLNAREIAEEFTVSVNTVKTHIRSIYAKLGVSSRRAAVRRAQDTGLLP